MRRAFHFCVATALLAACVAASSGEAGDATDPRRTARVLSAGFAPLGVGSSGITRDVGQLAVIEHDGSSYDRDNVAARAAVAQRFYERHGDNYDFVVVFTNFEFDTGDAVAFHNVVRNSVRGIGLPQVDNGPYFGAPGRLQGFVDMAAVARYRQEPQSLVPGSPGFVRTLNVLAHEVAHQWLARVRYRDASGAASAALLGKDGSHWSYLLDSDASVMYGSDWTHQGDGSFAATRVDQAYSALDLYLMGFLDPAKVGPFVLLRNPAIDTSQPPHEGDRVEAALETVTISQVIAAEGERSPSFLESQKAFRVGFVFLTAPGVEPDPADLEAVDFVRRAFPSHFFALTRGVAIADTTLAEAPPVATTPFPDLDRALAWLLERQGIDGRFEDSPHTTVRDTASAVDALFAAGVVGVPRERALGYLGGAAPLSVDALARQAAVLAPSLPAQDRLALVQRLLALQNPDGGFGAAQGFTSDALDTALALRALFALGVPLGPAVRAAIGALPALGRPGGGWAVVPGGPVSTVATGHVLLGLLDWKDAPEAAAPTAAGVAALVSRQNADGGFGESPSTPYATALALGALVRSGAPAAVTDAAIGWLQRAQQADGSWSGSRYPTALVLDALKSGVSPNLVVAAGSIAFAPVTVREGESVDVTATVANTGRSAAGPSRARLFDGPPAAGDLLGEADVPALAAGESASVSFRISTQDRAGSRTLYLAADAAEEVAESREDDNSASRVLQVEGLLPDLTILPGDLSAAPAPAEEGETVLVSVRVTNVGSKRAPATRLRLFDGDPGSGGALLGEAALGPLEAHASATLVLSWPTTGALGDHVLFAIADAAYAAHESNEANNEASVAVAVTGPLPPGPDLELTSLSVTPATLSRLPQPVELRAVVRNLGRDGATSTVRFESQPPIGTTPIDVPVDIPPRSSQTLVVPLSVESGGSRSFLASADPDDALAETREDNNRAGAYLLDPANTIDVELLDSDVQLSSRDLVAGETLRVTATVRNRGTTPLAQAPVVLELAADTGPRELLRREVTLAPGAQTTLTLFWLATITGDSVPLMLRADPFDLLREVDESNNAVALPVRVRASALPDLVALGAGTTFEPNPPREGEPATILVHVMNPSPVAAGPFSVEVYLGNVEEDPSVPFLGFVEVPGLDANGDMRVAVPWPNVDVRGAQGIFFYVDADDEVDEYDETNNGAFSPFQVQGLPDLVLTAGDVALAPAFPRVGEAVAIHATVRNLGGQPAAAFQLRVLEGEAPATVVVEQTIDGLPPGASQSLQFAWTPAVPPGERTLTLVADPDDAVREQSEGNNAARRSVLVQDADLFLSAPYFSPNGDGVQDLTTLGYRASAEVAVVVSNARGQLVRTLADRAPAQGSLVWDGRDEDGLRLADGPYTITLLGEGGGVLGRIVAVLDTDRSPIHEAVGTGLVAIQQLTGQLPEVSALAWMPEEDEALVIVPEAQGDIGRGLARVSLDGSYAYVAQDPWYDWEVEFVGAAAVSPDGREVLVRRRFELTFYAVDLATGARRVAATGYAGVSWSPDGLFLAVGDSVYTREGEFFAGLPPADPYGYGRGWAWSPDGRQLAAGNTIVSRDGEDVREIPLPPELEGPDPYGGRIAYSTSWLGDGRIHTVIATCGDGCYQALPLLIDPDTGTVERHPLESGQWSPDGSRVLYAADGETLVAQQDGTNPIPLVKVEAQASPRRSLASYACGGCLEPGNYELEFFAVRNLLNLTAEFRVVRLPGGNGVLLRGIAADRNLDHYQLDYAEPATPETWRPIGAASEIPVNDDVLAVWAPPRPGTYLVRLRASDRAGNLQTRVRTVSWDRTPILADITQDALLISPNGDGVKDAVTFHYTVQEPTRVEVRIVGPGEPGPTVRALGLEHPQTGAASFSWDGRDASGAVVPDGRYTVFLNELPLRVDVDTTPPDAAFVLSRLAPGQGLERCVKVFVTRGQLKADRSWHVVDAHLKLWQFGHENGDAPVYEPERDAQGKVVLDGVVPRIRRVGGRAADRKESLALEYTFLPGEAPSFVAEDWAGNRVVIPAPIEQKVWLLEARESCEKPRILPPVEPARAYVLTEHVTFKVASTVRSTRDARFQYLTDGVWMDGPAFDVDGVWAASFPELGVRPGRVYRGRFAADGDAGLIVSDEFKFRVCDDYLNLDVSAEEIPGSTSSEYAITIGAAVHEPLVSATLHIRSVARAPGVPAFEQTVALDRIDAATFRKTLVAPTASCLGPIVEFRATVVGESGHVYQDDGVCAVLVKILPACAEALAIFQEFDYARSIPDTAHLELWGLNSIDGAQAVLDREASPDPIPVARVPMPLLPPGSCPDTILCPFARVDMDASGVSDGDVGVFGRIELPGQPPPPERGPNPIVVDHTPAEVTILQPIEDAQICPSRDPTTGRELATVVVQALDAGPAVEPETLEVRSGAGAWRPLVPGCRPGDRQCERAFGGEKRLKVGVFSTFLWDLTELGEGEQTLRLRFADRAGNRSSVERRVSLLREPPTLSPVSTSRPAFSPNGDGRFDDTLVTVRSYQALRFTASVHRGTASGPLVRTLVSDKQLAAGDQKFTWDGRDDAGQVVADGAYALVSEARDPCGKSTALAAPLQVDTTPPVARIDRPAGGEPLGPSVDVRGAATDDRFASYELSYGVGATPSDWIPFAAQASQVGGPLGLLGRWDTPPTPGVYSLRLLASDAVGNPNEARVVVNVGSRSYVSRLGASPDVFSPNGDGRRETTLLEYELAAPGTVTLQIRSAQGDVLRSLETGASRSVGTHSVEWDGGTDGGTPAPEGEQLVFLHVEDPALAGAAEDQAVTVVLDRTPPLIGLERPPPDGYVSRDAGVTGSIADPRLRVYVVEAAAPAGHSVELARGAQARTSEILASLESLADGRYTLSVSAEDLAENRSRLDVPFTLDSAPPLVRFVSPTADAVVPNGASPADVVGTVADDNLEGWVLSFGSGGAPSPAALVEIARSPVGGNALRLAAWPGAGFADGIYTLVLSAKDRAGHSAETRSQVTLDGTPPLAQIDEPAEGAFLNVPPEVVGAALDANFESWKLEAAPGPAASAFQWSAVGNGTAEVEGEPFASWPLPPDGVHTLRLTVHDRAGHSATAHRTVNVDTTPPAAPSGLRAQPVPLADGGADVVLTWNANPEPDLAGYRVRRAQEPAEDSVDAPSFTDPAREDGTFDYEVVAVDRAGNRSEPAKLRVRVDLTPPAVAILSPASGAAVSGVVRVRGTAFSPDDFKEYRLSVGVGEQPSAWTLLKRSTLPVSAGSLGAWTAIGDGPHVLLLEAEDTSGNLARAMLDLVVDNQPPLAPVLSDVAPGSQPDALVPTWQASASGDVAGYLVERDGHIANAPAVVLGDLRGYLLPGPSYTDAGLPDGVRCYVVLAMDEAGNLSPPSNRICRTLDNRAPHAPLVEPPDGLRFEHPIRVVAFTPDTDVSSVAFQVKRSSDADWGGLGPPDTTPPFETTFDPAGRSFGEYELRAVATDATGKTDPDPSSIRVVYGDTTAPATPAGLTAQVHGAEVTLTWTANAEADVAGYVVDRDGGRLTFPALPSPSYVDTDVPAGPHGYEVRAVDQDGNESRPASVGVLIYGVSLDAPFPVTLDTSASLTGSGAQAGTVHILRDGSEVAAAATAGPGFRVDAVPLQDGPNLLRAVGSDAAGNESLRSDEVVLIANQPPAPVTGLLASLDGRAADLLWDAGGDADLFGYVVERDGARLTGSSPQTVAAEVSASNGITPPAAAFDGDAATAWRPSELPATWSVRFPEPILVDRVVVRFDESLPGVLSDYRVEALWEGRFLPLAVVAGNASQRAEHVLPSAFATDTLQLVAQGADAPAAVAEVEVRKLDAVPAAAPAFRDPLMPDGAHRYAVSAVDRYGAVGAPAGADLALPLVPPEPPTGLSASVVSRDVALAWDASPEPDVVGYAVLRDGVRIAQTAAPQHLDRGLGNGSFVYNVLAIDSAGQESGLSAPALAVVSVPSQTPEAPEIVIPTTFDRPITLAATATDVGGFADAGALVTLEVNGAYAGTVLAAACPTGFTELAGAAAPADFYGAAASRDGSAVALSWNDPATGLPRLTLADLRTGTRHDVSQPGAFSGGLRGPDSLSGDAGRLVYVASTYEAPYGGLYLLDLASGARRLVDGVSFWHREQAFSRDGSRLAYVGYYGSEYRLLLWDVATATSRLLLAVPSSQEIAQLRWSPDGSRLLFSFSPGWPAPAQLRILDAASGEIADVDPAVAPGQRPDWSPDGLRVVYVRSDGHVVVRELASGALSDLGEGGLPRYDPAGDAVSLLVYGPNTASIVAADLATGTRQGVVELPLGYADLHEWTDFGIVVSLADRVGVWRRCPRGAFKVPGVPLAPGENVLVARELDLGTTLVSPDSAPVRIEVPESAYPDLEVRAAEITSYPRVPRLSEAARLDVVVRNVGATSAPDVRLDLVLTAPGGGELLRTSSVLGTLEAGGRVTRSLTFTPQAPGLYTLVARVDPDGVVVESSKDNNAAQLALRVVASDALVATLGADRASYPARTPVVAQVAVLNPGVPFAGAARLFVRDGLGREVATLDSRALALDYGQTAAYAAAWNTGSVYAGEYALRLVVSDAAGETRAQAEAPFGILADVDVAARLLPDRPTVTAGAPASFRARIDNRGANSPLTGHTATFRILAAGQPVFEQALPLAPILPGGTLEASLVWPVAAPAASYLAELRITASDGALRAAAQAGLSVVAPSGDPTGGLALLPSQVLAGDPTTARVSLTNPGSAPLLGLPVAVEVSDGVASRVLARASASVDLSPGETREIELAVPSAGLAPRSYPVFLRTNTRSLARATLGVHAALGAPSLDAPADGAVVATARPTLRVNNAVAPPDATLSYSFELFADAALQQQLQGSEAVPQQPGRTSWTVATALAEDRSFYWRARAGDGFSFSPWTPVASFTVDERNQPPSSPAVDSPKDGSTVATREPALVVQNAYDPELAHLTYEFRLSRDPGMSEVVAQATGVAETFGLTAWTPPLLLDEDASYYWSARAGDGTSFSAWTPAAGFRVDSENAPPTAPTPSEPVGVSVASTTPRLVVLNARDPEGAPLVYRFEIDRVASFDSAELQVSEELSEELTTTGWTPPRALADNARYYWRAAASDGLSFGPWAFADFFVNTANDPPSTPVPLAPGEGEVVASATPLLRVRNATDLDGDALVYDFRVEDAAGAPVAAAEGVAETSQETAWTVDVALQENGAFRWSARARDASSASDWSAPQSFRVNAVHDAPTAPVLVAPLDGATLAERRPALIVQNATSPDGLALAYAFELYREEADGPVLVDSAAGVPEGVDTTSFTPRLDLADGSYTWRARAEDGVLSGPWMPSARFQVRVDVPPSPPTGLAATPGDAQVRLTWQSSPESDVSRYRVYRGSVSGGPYGLVTETGSTAFQDSGLANGVTYYYVVTALDARFESAFSSQVAATPQAAGAVPAQIAFLPAAVDAECLFASCDRRHGEGKGRKQHGHVRFGSRDAADASSSSPPTGSDRDDDHDDDDDTDEHCPSLLGVTIELPVGQDPATIDVASVRLAGTLVPVGSERRLRDRDRDGLPERLVYFRFGDVAPLLQGGANRLRVSGRFASGAFEGEGSLQVRPLELEMKLTPESLVRRAPGGDVRARLDVGDELGLSGEDVALSSLRLQWVLAPKRIVKVSRKDVTADFDRAQLLALLPSGKDVTVVLSGRIGRVTFEARDSVKVKD